MRPDLVPGLWLLAAVGGSMATPAEPLPPVTAFVTRIDGAVSAEGSGGRLLELRPGQVLPGDSRISVAAGSAVSLVCSNERRAVLEADATAPPARRSVQIPAEAACAGGDPLLPGTYRALARGDRDLALERSGEVRHRILQVNTRGGEEDDPRVPILQAPRETAVRDPRPEIRWTRVPQAEDYVLELVGTTPWAERLRAREVPCETSEHPPGHLDVCTAPWPASAPDLAPGETVFLTVGARTGTVTPLRAGEEHALSLLPPDLGERMEAALAAVGEAGMPRAEATLREVVLLAEHGLRGEATARLREGLSHEASAQAYLLLGSLELERQLPRAAIRSFEEALRLAPGDQVLAHEAEAGVALARRLLGSQGAEADPDVAEASRLQELAIVAMDQFRPAEALRHVDAALALVQGKDQDLMEVGLRGLRAAILAALQETEQAEEDLEPLMELLEDEVSRRRKPADADLAPLLEVLPALLLSSSTGQFESGLEELRELQRHHEDLLPPAMVKMLEMVSLLEAERAVEAAALCHEVERDLETDPQQMPPQIAASLALMCGAADFLATVPDEGPVDPAAVGRLFETTGHAVESQPGPFQEPVRLLLEQVGGMTDAVGKPEEWPSRADLQPVLDSVEGTLAAAAPAGMRARLDGLFNLFPQLGVSIRSEAGDAAESFDLAEQARARELLDRLADSYLARHQGNEQTRRIALLRERRDAIQRRIVDAPWAELDATESDRLVEELRTVHRDLADAFRRMALARDESARAEPLPLREIQARLADDTTLVAYLTFWSGDDPLAWVVDPDEVHLVTLDLDPARLEADVRLFHRRLRAGLPVNDLAEQLYRLLWTPLAAKIETSRVLVVPHGPLQELPFAALRDSEADQWLVEQATLLYAPSASVWARLHSRPAVDLGPPLVLADPDGDLPAARREAQDLAALWNVRPHVGKEASEATLRAAASTASLVHVSSHGVLSPHEPFFSYLKLAPSGNGGDDPRHDGRVELHEVTEELDLRGTSLVVLPACHGAEGPRTAGDEVTSLARAFLLAGARATVTTAWAVEDSATGELMVDFHRHLAAGVDPAEALRLAQLAALAPTGRSHPSSWAAFALHGAGGPLPRPH